MNQHLSNNFRPSIKFVMISEYQDYFLLPFQHQKQIKCFYICKFIITSSISILIITKNKMLLLFIMLIVTNQLQLEKPLNQRITNNNRILQNSAELHRFRTKVDLDVISPLMTDLVVLKHKLDITTNYYSLVIKVKQQDFDYVKYNDYGNDGVQTCLVNQIPQKYITDGFNPNTTDMIVIPKVVRNQAIGVFDSTYCQLRSWVVYSAFNINLVYFEHVNFQYHEDIVNLVMMFTHFFGMNYGLFSYFYKTLDRIQFYPISEVVKKNGQNKQMVVTPNVLNYVQDYFDCHDGKTGALLEDQYTYPTLWQIKVFNDLVIDIGYISRGRKITQLTLNLFKDTNYYEQVDVSLSWPAFFGKGKGCDFANGLLAASSPQFCTSQTIEPSCDMFHDYWGDCITQGGANNYKRIIGFGSGFCRYQRSSTNLYEIYGGVSRCIMVQNTPQCFLISCSSDKNTVYIAIGSKNYTCDGTQATVFVPQLLKKITCPSIQIICQNQACPNWCDKNGFCINGICHNVCTIQNCLQCSDSSGIICSQCLEGYYLNQSQSVNQCFRCSSNCLSCQNEPNNCTSCNLYSSIPVLSTSRCISCDKGNFFDLSTKNCVQCDSRCAQCIQKATKCTLCSFGKTLINNNCHYSPKGRLGFYESNQKKYLCELGCKYCQSLNGVLTCLYASIGYALINEKIILCPANCLQCTSSIICTKCLDEFYLQSNKCLECPKNCLKCSKLSCQICIDGYFVNSQNQCEIGSVLNCQLTNFKNNCTKCKDGYVQIQSNTICQQCPSSCSRCSNTNISICEGCTTGFYLNGSACQNCVEHCIECSNSKQCINCQDGYQKNQQFQCIKECEFPCLSCVHNLANSCTDCVVGYVLVGSQCKQDLSYGSKLCPLGYKKNNNQNGCISCKTSNCAVCTLINSLQQCTFCLSSYFLNSYNQCQICLQGCIICLNSHYCQRCANGFTKLKSKQNSQLQSGLCYACQNSCKTCRSTISQCTSCEDGFILIGMKCVKSKHIKIEITLLASYQIFTQSGAHIYQFRKGLLNALNLNPQNIQKVTVTSITKSSVSIKAIYDNPQITDEALCSQSTNLQNLIKSGTLLADFTTLSSTFTSTNNNCINVDNTSSSSDSSGSSSILIIILAIVIPFCIFLLCSIFCIIGCIYYKNKGKVLESSIKNENIPAINSSKMFNASDNQGWLYQVHSRNIPYLEELGHQNKPSFN